MSVVEALLIAVVAAAVVCALLLVVARRALVAKGGDASAADRLRLLEEDLRALREAKAEGDKTLAAKLEALAHHERAVADLRERLEQSTQSHAEATALASTLAAEKAAVEGQLQAMSRDAATHAAEMRSRLENEQTRVEAAARELAAFQSTNAQLNAEQARLGEALVQEKRKITERLEDLREQKERLRADFKEIAQQVLGQGGEALAKQHDGLLAPLREQIGKFEAELRQAHIESAKDREGLRAQVQSLTTNGAAMVIETRQLTHALRGESQTQGAWGEMILAAILEKSGLREGHEYVTQQTHTTEEGQRLRPDVLVHMPQGKTVVVDAKVSLAAFTDCVNEMDPAAKARHVERHVASLRSHIKGLSEKNYAQVSGEGLDFVMMFVPIEGALAAALQHDPYLASVAAEHHVAITTPTTLLIALKTIASVWRVERRNKNAEEIAARAGKLYDKFVGFAGDLSELGKQLKTTHATYDAAMGKLQLGRGNLVGQVEKLKELGAKTSKALPRQLAADSDSELAEPAA